MKDQGFLNSKNSVTEMSVVAAAHTTNWTVLLLQLQKLQNVQKIVTQIADRRLPGPEENKEQVRVIDVDSYDTGGPVVGPNN